MLTARQLLIFKCIVEEFVETAEPVGSKLLMTKYQLPYSSATIRNECLILKNMDIWKKCIHHLGVFLQQKGIASM